MSLYAWDTCVKYNDDVAVDVGPLDLENGTR